MVSWCRRQGRSRAGSSSTRRRSADFDVLCLQEIANNFPDPLPGRQPRRKPVRRTCALAAGIHAGAGHRGRCPGDEWPAATLRQHDPVALAGRTGVPSPASLSGRSGCQRHAAHRGRGGDRCALRSSARDHDASGVLRQRRSARRRSRRCAPSTPKAAAMRAWAASSIRRADRSTRDCALRRRSSPATSISSPTIRLHARIGAPFDDGTPPLRDAWEVAHPGEPHPATFKIYEKELPDEPELHCDFIFVSEDLAQRVRAVRVDQKTQASDHQPVLLELR